MNIIRVAVLGANGTIGSKVAGLFAGTGGLTVYLITRSMSSSLMAVNKALKATVAGCPLDRLIPKTYDDMQECIQNSQWVFEAITEDIETKLQINKSIAMFRKSGTIVSTSTSGLSIEELSLPFDVEGRSHYFGTHFFNPPKHQLLCELTSTTCCNKQSYDELENFLVNRLGRKVIHTTDKPAFLGNRIGFVFMNEAAQYAQRFKERGGVDYIDSIIGPFTGRAIPPLDTIDFVGLDIHKAIVDYLHITANDSFKEETLVPQYINNLIGMGNLGHKKGCGLYKKDRQTGKIQVYDILTSNYRDKRNYSFGFANTAVARLRANDPIGAFNSILCDSSEEAAVCIHFLLKHIVCALYFSKVVSNDYHSADIAMAFGFSWIPPLALFEILGGAERVKELIAHDPNITAMSQDMSIDDLLNNAPQSKIAYSKYLTAKL